MRVLIALLAASALSAFAAAATWHGPAVAEAEDLALPPPPGAFIGGFAFDGGGVPVVFDGEAVVRWQEGAWEELYRPPAPVFGSFLQIRGTTLYVGESSAGTITAVDLETLSHAVVETVGFNYDMAFDDQGRAVVSAPAPDSTMEEPKNALYLVDLDPATPPDPVIELPGYSGPLAFGPDGRLYVATARFGGPVEVYRFLPETLDAGIGDGIVTTAEGSVFAADLPGAYSLTFGPFGLLLAGDAVTGQILALRPNGAALQWAAPIDGFAAATYLDYDPVAGRVGAVTSDFASFNRLTLLATDFRFRRGTVNEDDVIDIADAISILSYLFSGGASPLNLDRLDTNDSGAVEVGDAVYLLMYLFVGGPPPPDPFQAPGLDPTPDGLGR